MAKSLKSSSELALEIEELRAKLAQAQTQLAEAQEVIQATELTEQTINRTLKALNNGNRALLHATDEAVLLDQICKIITQDCGYAMVWISFAEDDEQKTVRPVADAGFEEGYLASLRITWADSERGHGPTGTAIRTGQPCSCRNMLTEPTFEPWRAEVLKHGYVSSLALPLMADGKAFGAVTIYSKQPDAFPEDAVDEVKVLLELVANLAYGISTLRVRAARDGAEEALRQNREWLRVTLTSIGDAVMTADTHGRVTYLNPEAVTLTGWQPEEAQGQPIQRVFHIINEQTRVAAEDIVARVLEEGRIFELTNHTALVTKDGREVPIEDSAAPIRDSTGNVIGVVLVFHDVTEKRRAQEAIHEAEQRVRRKLDSILSPESDIGGLELGDILDVPAVQSLMEDFYKLSHIPVGIIDLKGNILVGIGWQEVCTSFHRANPTTYQHCLQSDLELSAGAAPGEFKLYKCENNIWDAATPITVGGKHIGNFFLGQFFFEDSNWTAISFVRRRESSVLTKPTIWPHSNGCPDSAGKRWGSACPILESWLTRLPSSVTATSNWHDP